MCGLRMVYLRTVRENGTKGACRGVELLSRWPRHAALFGRAGLSARCCCVSATLAHAMDRWTAPRSASACQIHRFSEVGRRSISLDSAVAAAGRRDPSGRRLRLAPRAHGDDRRCDVGFVGGSGRRSGGSGKSQPRRPGPAAGRDGATPADTHPTTAPRRRTKAFTLA